MKTSAPALTLLTPQSDGWLLHPTSGGKQKIPSLDAAAAWIPEDQTVHLAIPSNALLIERLTLPSGQREELYSMARLQLEKTLPFPIDEVASDFSVVSGDEKSTTLVSVAIREGVLEEICQPLRERGRLPRRLTPYVSHVAAACPVDEVVLTLHAEQGHLVIAICEHGKLGWVHVLTECDERVLLAELPHLLLVAAMQGASTTLDRVLVAPECEGLAPKLSAYFLLPVEPLQRIEGLADNRISLIPQSWLDLEDQAQRKQRVWKWLLAGVWIVLTVGAAMVAYLWSLSRQAQALASEVATLQAKTQRVQALQARSTVLAGAIDRSQYGVEILYLIQRNLPSPLVQLTEFELRRDQWRIVGEAPSAQLAIEYLQRLKADVGLGAYEISAGPPQLVGNDRAQFEITAKQP